MPEKFAGIRLAEYLISNDPVREAEFFAIASSITLALREVHGQGAIHGNINPATIFIHREPGRARVVESTGVPSAGFAPAYSPYIAPEQTEQFADFRSDLYSLGIVFYEILTGLSPYRAPAHMEYFRTAGAVPAGMENNVLSELSLGIVEKLLRPSPDERHQNCGELLEHLQRDRPECRGSPREVNPPERLLQARVLEKLLFATREMMGAPDQFAAAGIALRYMCASLGLPDDVPRGLVTRESPEFTLARYRLLSDSQPARAPTPETPARMRELREMRSVRLEGTTLLIPARMEDEFQALLEIGRVPRDISPREEEYILGLAGSLALALAALRNHQRDKLDLIGRFASEIVHDVNNHISTINLGRHMLAEGEFNVNVPGIIESETRLLQGMASDILDFARGFILLERKEVHTTVLEEKIRADLELFLRERKLTLVVDLEYEGPVYMDLNRMRRVMMNLARNTADAAKEPGEFRVALRGQDDLIYLLVSDTGPGIPPEIRANLFSPFAAHGKSAGAGLGLAAVQRIVKAHEGEITCESEPGAGTLFRIVLPIKPTRTSSGE